MHKNLINIHEVKKIIFCFMIFDKISKNEKFENFEKSHLICIKI